MPRAPLQIVVIPFRKTSNGLIEYAVFHRTDGTMWHFVSGGAEDNETADDAAIRELKEEAGITVTNDLINLDSRASIPKTAYPSVTHWSEDLFVLPQFAFAIDVTNAGIVLSDEHNEFRWLDFENATKLLKWDSDKVALWELNERLTK